MSDHAKCAHDTDSEADLCDQVAELTATKDGAYKERNQVVALLARMWCREELGKAGLARHDENDASWEKDWMNIVIIDLPTGQVSWHFHDSDMPLFVGLPDYPGKWDGHSTPEKYRRVNMAWR